MTLSEMEQELERKTSHCEVVDDRSATWYPCRKDRGEFEYAPGKMTQVVNEEGEIEYMFLTQDGRLIPIENW